MPNITDATYSIYGIVAYNDNTWAPISMVFSLNDIFTLVGSNDAMCEISNSIPELLTDINNGLSFDCTHIHKTVTDYSLSVTGVVTYDDQTTVPYLAQYVPNKHIVIFPTLPLQEAIASSPVSSELLQASASVSVGGSSVPPDAPTELEAFASNASVLLTWIASVGADSYNIKRATVTDGPYTTINTSAINSFTDTTVTNDIVYYYVVSAVNSGGESANSNEASALPNLADNAMQAVGFTVPFTTTVNVSGGSAALQSAITAAGAGTRLMIQDSMAYSPVTISAKTNLTIDALSGETPSITAVAGSGNHCVTLGAGNSGLAIKKLRFVGSGNENNLSQQSNGLVWGYNGFSGMTALDRLIVEDCVFSEPAPATSGSPGIQLGGTDGTVHTNVWVHRCTFKNNAAGANVTTFGYGACTVGGFTNVFVQNCRVVRENAVIVRGSSHMRGVVIKSANVHVENVLCEDLGTAGSNEGFKHNNEAIFGTVVGTSTWRNNVAYNCKRGYRLSLVGTTMNTINSVFHNDVAGIAASQVIVQNSGTHNFKDSIIAGAGDGTAFAASTTEDHNDIFNVAAPGKTLDVTDLTVDPVFHNVANFNFTADAASLQTGGSDSGLIGVRYTATGEALIWATP